MKTLICAMFLSLLWVSPAFSQEGRPFYNVCKSDADLIGDFQRESITVKTLDSDSLVFVSAGTTYSGKTSSGSDLLVGGKGGAAFYARKVDNNSFLIASGESGSFSDYGAFVYYHADKSKADQGDDKRRCSFHPRENLSSFQTSVRSFEKTKGSNEKIVFDAQTKGVITSWTKNYTSRRVDPALERGIVKWWKGPDPTKIPDPILHIYFLEPNYEIARNAFGEVLRKTVDALILWKERTGSKCYIQWRSFGYESLGGGTFSTEMEMWTLDRDIPMAGGRKILAGSWYAVDCAPFVK